LGKYFAVFNNERFESDLTDLFDSSFSDAIIIISNSSYGVLREMLKRF